MRSDLAAAALSLACFGFLALLAWTGGLAEVHSNKARLFAWIVEDVSVGHLGRPGATVLFAGLGLASVPAVLWVRRRWYFG